VLVLIPARYASSRFPGKPLVTIAGKSMIEWVFNHCSEANDLAGNSALSVKAVVVTDDERIESCVKDFGGDVVRVDDDVISGTERVWLAYERFFKNEKYDLIINVQGDEPLLRGEDICELAGFHFASDFDVATLVKKQDDKELMKNPNVVKAIWSAETSRCLYFSRSSIPYDRNEIIEEWFSHVGVYSYRPQALQKFCSLKPSYYEKLESLEQLRALEAGLSIGALLTQKVFVGVDAPEDIKKFDGVLK
jgi:3-deoxy-manno-octulosonate cytidylyltransferase (CMP-KDO synthetase)